MGRCGADENERQLQWCEVTGLWRRLWENQVVEVTEGGGAGLSQRSWQAALWVHCGPSRTLFWRSAAVMDAGKPENSRMCFLTSRCCQAR